MMNDQVKEDQMGRACMREKGNAYKVLVEKLEGNIPLGKLRRR
jgi:hypothetical protein